MRELIDACTLNQKDVSLRAEDTYTYVTTYISRLTGSKSQA